MVIYKLEEILLDDPLWILENVKPKNPVITEDDRLINSFEEINSFVDREKREPQKNMSNMQEMKLYSRLKGIRESLEKRELLKKYDRHKLLIEPTVTFDSVHELIESDPLGILEDEEDIFTLKHVTKSRE